MKRDFQSDYTFTNELLFIEDLLKSKYKNKEIALEMGWASKSDPAALKRQSDQVQKYIRMLAIIRELQHLSGSRLPLTDFDSHKQAILELDDDYEALKKRDSEAARRLRDTRLAALLAGVGYRELREINETFLDEYLVPMLEDQPAFKKNLDRVFRPIEVDPIYGTTFPGFLVGFSAVPFS